MKTSWSMDIKFKEPVPQEAINLLFGLPEGTTCEGMQEAMRTREDLRLAEALKASQSDTEGRGVVVLALDYETKYFLSGTVEQNAAVCFLSVE